MRPVARKQSPKVDLLVVELEVCTGIITSHDGEGHRLENTTHPH